MVWVQLLENLFLFFRNVLFLFLNYIYVYIYIKYMYVCMSEYWFMHMSIALAEARGEHWISWDCSYRQL